VQQQQRPVLQRASTKSQQQQQQQQPQQQPGANTMHCSLPLDVCIAPGASAALEALCRVLLDPGDVMVVEEFSYSHFVEAQLLPQGCAVHINTVLQVYCKCTASVLQVHCSTVP
jgi:DNA-binding transcriptional MocR family regulator